MYSCMGVGAYVRMPVKAEMKLTLGVLSPELTDSISLTSQLMQGFPVSASLLGL